MVVHDGTAATLPGAAPDVTEGLLDIGRIFVAKRCPASDHEVIEVRQVQEFEDFSPEVQKAGRNEPALREQLKQRQGS